LWTGTCNMHAQAISTKHLHTNTPMTELTSNNDWSTTLERSLTNIVENIDVNLEKILNKTCLPLNNNHIV